MADTALVDEHLRDHLTDGHYHDRCVYCLIRRSEGGTGVSAAELIAYEVRQDQAYQAAVAEFAKLRELEDRRDLIRRIANSSATCEDRP